MYVMEVFYSKVSLDAAFSAADKDKADHISNSQIEFRLKLKRNLKYKCGILENKYSDIIERSTRSESQRNKFKSKAIAKRNAIKNNQSI